MLIALSSMGLALVDAVAAPTDADHVVGDYTLACYQTGPERQYP